jgi:hypothetical protein
MAIVSPFESMIAGMLVRVIISIVILLMAKAVRKFGSD